MGTLTYKKMSLFDAPKGAIIVHGCNGQGVWGSGIAKPFKEKYPKAFKEYNEFCTKALMANPEFGATGRALLTEVDNGHRVGCLITSLNYASKRDAPGTIMIQTILALKDLLAYLNTPELALGTIYSNKFNSGLFGVQWQHTEKVLRHFVTRYDINWVVCDPDM